MRKIVILKRSLVVLPILFFACCISLFLLFTNPVLTKAQTSYSSLNCPTPIPGQKTLQLVPCTPSGVVSQGAAFTATTAPASANSVSPVVQPSNQSGSESGNVCTPDSTIAKGSSCTCQSDLEPDADCTVATQAICTQNGGMGASEGMEGLGILLGFGNTGSNNGGDTTDTNSNGTFQCIWLDSAPVPAAANATNCSIECNSKPVLYFYSPTSLSINVALDIPGFITKSVPYYPTGGWQNVIIHPKGTMDGTLVYNNETYNELYYEDETIKAQPPTEGFVIKASDLAPSLRIYTAKLGLNTSEQNEFIAYWLPRLTQLNAPYIFFSVFDQTQKEKVDHVIVSPAPTTTIAFLAYFKPLSSPITVAPLQFPNIPQRQGFTMVEWGGTIDNN